MHCINPLGDEILSPLSFYQFHQLHSPANFDFFVANKMAADVSEGILRAQHETGFSRKSRLKPLKIACLAIFDKL